MAEWVPSIRRTTTAKEDENADPTWGDYGSVIGGLGVQDVKGMYNAAGRYLSEKMGDAEGEKYYAAGSKLNEMDSEDTTAGLSAGARKRLQAAVTSEDFWNHPVSAGFLKTARMLPTLAAATVPAPLLPGAGAATLGAAGIGGAMASAQTLSDLYKLVDDAPEEKLREIPYYAGLRSVGMSEEEARRDYGEHIRGNKPLMMFFLGAVTNALGPAGQIARVAKGGTAAVGGAGRGVAKRVGLAGAEGGISEGAEEFAQDAAVQGSAIEGGLQKEFDYDRSLAATAEGALLGTVLGGATGVAPGSRTKAQAQPGVQPAAQPVAPAVTVTGPIVPDPAQAAAVAAATPPAPTPQVPVVAPPAPSQVVAAPPAAPAPVAEVPPQVAQASQRVQAATPVTSEVTTAPSEAVPPPVVEASQRVREAEPTPVAEPAAEIRPEPVVAAPEISPEPEAPRAPRVLPSLNKQSAEVEQVAKEAQDAAAPRLVEEKERGVGTGHRTEDEKAQAEAADQIFEDETPETTEFPTTDAEKKVLFDRLDRSLKRAKEEGVKIKKRVGAESTGKGYVWLAEAAALHKAMQSKSFTGARARDHITSFLTREAALRAGEVEGVKAERKSAGEMSNVQSGGTATVERAGGPDLEKDQVSTNVAKSAKGGVRGVGAPVEEKVGPLGERAKAASGVRKVELTPEAKAAAMKALAVAEKRANRGVVSTAEDGPVTSEVTPAPAKAMPKVEKAKAVAKARTEKAPKLKAVKAKVIAKIDKAAAKAVEPTPKQAAAGNYKQGHVDPKDFHGIPVTIETPKGQVRKNKNPNTPYWESPPMPGHYGSLPGTEGADSTPGKKQGLDITLGPDPDATHVFVIDQVDPDTKKFDEHKVFGMYNDAVTAMEHYEKSFSDHKGFDRIGKITPMPIEEFKTWYKDRSKTKKPVEDQSTETNLDEFKTLAHDGRRDGTRGDRSPVIQLHKDYASARPIYSTNAGAALRTIKTRGRLDVFLRARLIEKIANIPVHVMSEPDMASIIGRSFIRGERGHYGTYVWNRGTGQDSILLNAAQFKDTESLAHTLMHEATHAATSKAIDADPNFANIIRVLMNETQMRMELDASGIPEGADYAFTNEHEFLAEAFSNPEFQGWLAAIEVDSHIADAVGLGTKAKPTIWDLFVASIRRILGLPRGTHSMLEATLRVGESAMTGRPAPWRPTLAFGPVDGTIQTLALDIDKTIRSAITRAAQQEQQGSPKLLKVMTWDQMAQTAERFFGTDVVRRIADLREMTRVEAHKLLQESAPLIQKLASLERKYKGATWERFASLVHDETVAGVYADRSLADNDHLGKDRLDSAWAKAQHADLAAEYAQIPEDLRAARREAQTFFRDQQNLMSLSLIENKVLRALGVEDKALAQRIHTNTTTLADVDTVGGKHVMDVILDAKELAKIKGPYFPLMRHGDWVVRGTYKVTAPTRAEGSLRQIERNVWEFNDRDKAIAYAQKQTTPTDIKSRWVDKTTGETFVIDPTDGKEVKVSASDTNAEQRFRVIVQDQHVEFFQTKREARRAAAEYDNPSDGKPSIFDGPVKGVEEKKFEVSGRQANMMSGQLDTLMRTIEKRQQYKDMSPSARNEIIQGMNIAAIKFLGSTRVQSRRLPRRRVAGYSTDVIQNAHDYAVSVSGYRAKLKHEPALEAARKEMLEAVGDDQTKSNSMGRRAISNEIQAREATDNAYLGKQNPWVNRALTTSFLDKLWGPSHNIINSMQTAMVAMPYLAGRHHVGRTFTELGRAYNDIAGWSIVKKGLRETVKGVTGKAETPNFAQEIKDRLTNADEKEFIDYVVDRGSLDPDAGLEIAELMRSRGKGVGGAIDKGLGYLEGIARQMPRSIEAINRAATGLAAFRLEMSKNGGDKAAAFRYAQEAINNTQGQYSASNAAPVFNHPLAKLSLQFKKYGQMIYFLLGSQVGKAYRNASPGERAEAIKTLALLTGTHVAMAGALGLPTEPFKWLLMSAKAAGLTAVGWGDVEDWERKAISGAFGTTAGELIAKGLPRAIGIDLSGRVGMDNLIGGFGEPGNKKNDVKAWIFDTVIGATGSLGVDVVEGANDLMAGNFAPAAEKLIPMKTFADGMKSYRMATEGKKAASGRQVSEPYSAREVLTRVMGFTPAREAEEGAQAASFRRQAAKSKGTRDGLIQDWVNAKGPDKVKAQRAVQAWNKTAHPNEKITPKDLSSSAKRREKQGMGVVTNKRNQHILDRLEQVYNTP